MYVFSSKKGPKKNSKKGSVSSGTCIKLPIELCVCVPRVISVEQIICEQFNYSDVYIVLCVFKSQASDVAFSMMQFF